MSFSRRSLLFGMSALAGSPVISACAPASGETTGSSSSAEVDTSGPAAGELRLYVGGDTNVRDLWEVTLIPAFNAQFPDVNVSVQHDLHSERGQQTLAKLSAATDQNQDPGFDFIDESGVCLNAAKAGLLLTPTSENLPAIDDVPEATREQGLGMAVPYRASSVLLAYNPQTVTDVPESLTDVIEWIIANPGRFAYNSPATGGSGQAFVTSVLDMNITDAAAREKMTVEYDKELQQLWDPGFEQLIELATFVAGFIGDMAFHDAALSVNDGAPTLRIGEQELPCSSTTTSEPGDYVAGIRPEQVQLVPLDTPHATIGELRRLTPRGHQLEATIAVGEVVIRGLVPVGAAVVGERVGVRVGEALLYRDGLLAEDALL